MNNFSVRSLFSVPKSQNERVLPAPLADSVIALLNMLDLYANKKYSLFSSEELEKNGLTFSMRAQLRKKWYADETFIDGFIQENGKDIEPVVPLLMMWKHRVTGRFLVMKYFPEYALLQSLENTDAFFAIRSLTEDFEETVPQKPPYVIQTTLLPFYDTIIWDGILFVAESNITSIMAKEIQDIAKKVRKHDVAIKSLIKFDNADETSASEDHQNSESGETK